jgi:hypothetical protein
MPKCVILLSPTKHVNKGSMKYSKGKFTDVRVYVLERIMQFYYTLLRMLKQ